MRSINHRLFLPAVVAVLILVSTFAKANSSDVPLNTNKVVAAEKFAYGMYALQGQMKIRLAFENSTGSEVYVRISDSKGSLIYRETLRNLTELKRNYGLSAIGKGN